MDHFSTRIDTKMSIRYLYYITCIIILISSWWSLWNFRKIHIKNLLILFFRFKSLLKVSYMFFFYKKPLEAENSIQETEGLHSLPPKKLFYWETEKYSLKFAQNHQKRRKLRNFFRNFYPSKSQKFKKLLVLKPILRFI